MTNNTAATTNAGQVSSENEGAAPFSYAEYVQRVTSANETDCASTFSSNQLTPRRYHNSSVLSDVTIHYGKEGELTFYGHKLLLATKAQWFKKAFTSGLSVRTFALPVSHHDIRYNANGLTGNQSGGSNAEGRQSRCGDGHVRIRIRQAHSASD